MNTSLDRLALIWTYLTHFKPKWSMWVLLGKLISVAICWDEEWFEIWTYMRQLILQFTWKR